MSFLEKKFYFFNLFFALYFYLICLFILLYNTVLVLPYIDMNLPQVYIVKDYLYLLSLSSIFAFSHEPTRSFIFTTVSNRLLPNLAMASKVFIPITDTHIDVSATLTHFDCFSFRYFFKKLALCRADIKFLPTSWLILRTFAVLFSSFILKI